MNELLLNTEVLHHRNTEFVQKQRTFAKRSRLCLRTCAGTFSGRSVELKECVSVFVRTENPRCALDYSIRPSRCYRQTLMYYDIPTEHHDDRSARLCISDILHTFQEQKIHSKFLGERAKFSKDPISRACEWAGGLKWNAPRLESRSRVWRLTLIWAWRDRCHMNSDALEMLRWECVSVRQTHASFSAVTRADVISFISLVFFCYVGLFLFSFASVNTHTHTCCPSQPFCSVIGGEPRGRASFSECL